GGDDAPGRNRGQRGRAGAETRSHLEHRNDRRQRTAVLGAAERAGLAHLRDVLRRDADLFALRRGATRGHARAAGEPAGPVLDAAPGQGGAVFRRQSRSSRADAARRTDARALVRRRNARAPRALGPARGGHRLHELRRARLGHLRRGVLAHARAGDRDRRRRQHPRRGRRRHHGAALRDARSHAEALRRAPHRQQGHAAHPRLRRQSRGSLAAETRMTGAFVRAAALASALGPHLEAAVERLAGAPVAPVRNTKIGGAWPYFAIPISGGDWRMRTEAIARSVAEDLRRVAAIAPARWAELPCIVGSSSFSVGAWDDGGWEALEPSFEFASRLARGFGAHGPVTAVSTTCTSGL